MRAAPTQRRDLVDLLHFARSGSSVADLRQLPPSGSTSSMSATRHPAYPSPTRSSSTPPGSSASSRARRHRRPRHPRRAAAGPAVRVGDPPRDARRPGRREGTRPPRHHRRPPPPRPGRRDGHVGSARARMGRRFLHEPGDRRLPPGSERVPGRRRLLPGLLELRVLPRRTDLPQSGPGALGPGRQRAGPAVPTARHLDAVVGRRLRADAAPSRRPVLAHHHERRHRLRQHGVHRDGPGRPVVRPDRAARGAGRPGPRVGRAGPVLVHVRRRRAGAHRPGNRRVVRSAAPRLVRHARCAGAGGPTCTGSAAPGT